MLQVTEIIRRAEQGKTEPFLCRCDDGKLYYVKGKFAGYKALCAEWMAASLGRCLDLPIPPFSLVEVGVEMIENSLVEDVKKLGSGIWFASLNVDGCREITLSDVLKIENRLRMKILLFDYWIQNGDRVLTEQGGNPNLLIQEPGRVLHVIDHNAAFELDDDILKYHIFRDSIRDWSQEFIRQMTPLMESAVEKVDKIWQELPDRWIEEGSMINQDLMRDYLLKFKDDRTNFWQLL